MYERFFGLADAPFRLTPDPRFLFLSRKHADALAHLRLGLSESSGFGCITGDASDMLEDCLHTPDPVGRYGGSNYGGYSNPPLDQAIEASGWITSPQQRRKELQRIMLEVAEDLPWIPLYVDREVWGFHPYLSWRPRDDSAVLAQEIQLVNP